MLFLFSSLAKNKYFIQFGLFNNLLWLLFFFIFTSDERKNSYFFFFGVLHFYQRQYNVQVLVGSPSIANL